MSAPHPTPFGRIKVQLEATVPLIRALQAEPGRGGGEAGAWHCDFRFRPAER